MAMFRPDTDPLPQNAPPRPKRSVWLSLYLIIYGALEIIALILLYSPIFNPPRTLSGPLGAAEPVFQTARQIAWLLHSARLFCAIAAWRWKAWGVYGIMALALVGPILAVLVGALGPTDCIRPLLQIGILYLVALRQWKYFN